MSAFARLRDWPALATRAVNAALKYDPETRARLAQLQGRVCAVELIGPGVTIALVARADGVDIATGLASVADVRISGTPLDLLAYVRTRANGAAPAPGGRIAINGDLAVAQAFQALFAAVDIDWEEMLASRLGDVPAHQLGRVATGVMRWAAQAQQSLRADLVEYAKYEAQIVPVPDDVERFLAAVDTLRDDVDRLEARIARLAAAVQRGGGA